MESGIIYSILTSCRTGLVPDATMVPPQGGHGQTVWAVKAILLYHLPLRAGHYDGLF